MSGVGVDRSLSRRLGLAGRMVVTLVAITPINLAFSYLLLFVVGYPLSIVADSLYVDLVVSVLGLAGARVATVVPQVPLVSDPVGILLQAGVVVVTLLLAFVVPVRTGPELLLEDIDASEVDPGQEPRLERSLDRVARQAGAPQPRLALVESPVPRSFAAGRKGDGTVVVTRGLLDVLDDDELEAVLAHEVSHLLNRDAAVICYAAFYPLLLFDDDGDDSGDEEATGENADDEPTGENADAGGEGSTDDADYLGDLPFSSYRERDGAAGAVGTLLHWIVEAVVVVAMIPLVLAALAAGIAFVVSAVVWLPLLLVAKRLGGVLAAYLSRSREYAADRGAVAITGDPAALASALEKLGSAPAPTEDLRAADAVEPLAVLPTDPDAATTGDRGWYRTHPPTDERIDRLRGMTRRQERG